MEFLSLLYVHANRLEDSFPLLLAGEDSCGEKLRIHSTRTAPLEQSIEFIFNVSLSDMAEISYKLTILPLKSPLSPLLLFSRVIGYDRPRASLCVCVLMIRYSASPSIVTRTRASHSTTLVTDDSFTLAPSHNSLNLDRIKWGVGEQTTNESVPTPFMMGDHFAASKILNSKT